MSVTKIFFSCHETNKVRGGETKLFSFPYFFAVFPFLTLFKLLCWPGGTIYSLYLLISYNHFLPPSDHFLRVKKYNHARLYLFFTLFFITSKSLNFCFLIYLIPIELFFLKGDFFLFLFFYIHKKKILSLWHYWMICTDYNLKSAYILKIVTTFR